MSHAAVYRHVATKAELRDLVVSRWVETTMPPLRAIAARPGPAPQRLRRLIDALIAVKRRRAADDPELFAAYRTLAADARSVVDAHVNELVGLAATVFRDGVKEGTFRTVDPVAAGRAVLFATSTLPSPGPRRRVGRPGHRRDVQRRVANADARPVRREEARLGLGHLFFCKNLLIAHSPWRDGRMGRSPGSVDAQTPSDSITHKPLIHRMQQRLERVPVGEVAQPAPARLAHPSGRRRLPVIRAISQQKMHPPLVIRRRMLLVGHEKAAHAASDRMVRIDDFDAEPFQRTMADVSASDQVEISPVLRIKPHRIVKVQKATAAFDK